MDFIEETGPYRYIHVQRLKYMGQTELNKLFRYWNIMLTSNTCNLTVTSRFITHTCTTTVNVNQLRIQTFHNTEKLKREKGSRSVEIQR